MIAARHGLGIPLIAAAFIALAACSPSRGLEAMRVLADIDAGFGPSGLKQVTPPPRRTAVAYRVAGRARHADLYRPGDAPRARLVLVPGVAEDGKDDAQLVAFATTLARARFTVLVPDIGALRALKVRASDAREIADAFVHLAALDEAASRDRVGIAAISYAVGPAIIAALEPDVRDSLYFVLGIGGYHDIEAVVTFFTTGRHRTEAGGRWRWRRPNAYGKWVFVLSNLERVGNRDDRAALEAMARRKLDDLDADIADLSARLGPEGRAFDALLNNTDPERVTELIAALPAGVRADMAALDLSKRDLSRLRARLLLVHGREDDIIPFTESRALARAAPEGTADLHLIDGFSHVDPDPARADRGQLWRAVYRLLEIRDGVADAAPKP